LVQLGTPLVASPTFNITAPTDLKQVHYRWREDDGKETAFDVGDGTDGALAPTGTFNLNTSTSGGRTYADGIAYQVDAPADAATSVTGANVADDLRNGIVAGDEVLLINMQGASGDTADVGNYEFLEVQSVTATTITFTTGITKSYDGTTAANQKVVVQRVPNYTTVTLDSTDSITASAWNGLAAPTPPAGYSTGIVVLRATGTVDVGAGTSITVAGLGYRGGQEHSNGADCAAHFAYVGEGYIGGYGNESRNANSEGGGGGHVEGSNVGGGGGGGYGAVGTNGTTGQGSNSHGFGGGSYGAATLATILPGSGGGTGGLDSSTCTRIGAAGGAAGGIVYIIAETITASGAISANGVNGDSGTGSRSAGGGGGSGGSIKLEANTATLGSNITASGGTGGTGTNSQGNGGSGGVGRIRVEADNKSGTTTPTYSAGTTPSTGTGATWAADEDTPLTALAKSTTKRVRFEIANSGVPSGNVLYRLEVSEPTPTSCVGATTWTRINDSTHWNMVASTHFVEGDPTSNINPGLTDAYSTFVPGQLKDLDAAVTAADDETTAIALNGAELTEIEYAIQATTSSTGGATYCFRLSDAGTTTDFSYTESKYAKVTLEFRADITGTLSDGATEAEIVAGNETIIITLSGDTWQAAGTPFNDQRQAIINGLDSGQSELTGWTNEVEAKQGVGGVVRTSDTVVTITLDAQAAYGITADETITVTVPASALTGSVAIVGTPTFKVLAAVTAAIGSTNPASLVESNLNGATVTVDLTDGTYNASLATGDFSLNGAPTGTTISGVVRDSATQATLTLAFNGTDF
ncbi:hypothetical protein MYX75_13345, partial [Acidobacteria bacterium AH-259-A15]|nr:hypothetical protein [Acidobacteria bacterium AH-259-A15]